MKKESIVQNEIRLALSPYAVMFRTNAGTFWQGQRVLSKEFNQMVLINLRKVEGLPEGYSDLSGVRKSDGKAVFIEVKKSDGIIKPEQEHFIEVMKSNNAIAGVARSDEDALKIIL